MNTITIWRKTSTNFQANKFIRNNGTNTAKIESDEAAIDLMNCLMRNKNIYKAILESPNGCLSWERNPPDFYDEESDLEDDSDNRDYIDPDEMIC